LPKTTIFQSKKLVSLNPNHKPSPKNKNPL
jgi:hypothetical protein